MRGKECLNRNGDDRLINEMAQEGIEEATPAVANRVYTTVSTGLPRSISTNILAICSNLAVSDLETE